MKSVRQKLINKVRAKADPYKIILQILDQLFSIIIRKILANSIDLQRVIQKNYLEGSESDEKIATAVATNIITNISYIHQDRNIKAGVHSITIIKRLFSIAAAPTVPVTVNRIIEYSALINTGAELNMITTNVTNKAGLTIKTRVKIKISSYSEHTSRFLRIIENILISIYSVACYTNIFVTRSAPQPLILEISYFYSARA